VCVFLSLFSSFSVRMSVSPLFKNFGTQIHSFIKIDQLKAGNLHSVFMGYSANSSTYSFVTLTSYFSVSEFSDSENTENDSSLFYRITVSIK